MPVRLRPPWVKISQRSASPDALVFFASMATTIAWAPNFSEASATRRRSVTTAVVRRAMARAVRGRCVDRHIVGTGEKQRPHVLDAADAAADRHRHEADLGSAADDVEVVSALLVAGGDVEEAEFVGARRVIGTGAFDRIAGVGEV